MIHTYVNVLVTLGICINSKYVVLNAEVMETFSSHILFEPKKTDSLSSVMISGLANLGIEITLDYCNFHLAFLLFYTKTLQFVVDLRELERIQTLHSE